MSHSRQYINSGSERYELTWFAGADVSTPVPITHVHGVIFDKDGKILIGRQGADKPWTLFGGKIESGETVEGAFRRELLEEANATAREVYVLGVQKVKALNRPKSETNPYFQVRCSALLSELLPQTPDPGSQAGIMWERKFVASAEVEQYVQWGENGHAMFAEAISLYVAELSRAE